MGYNFDKNTCDRCGITKEENEKNYKDRNPFLSNYENRMTTSFHLGFNEEVWCPGCHGELELEKLFALMDKREAEGVDLKKIMGQRLR